MEFDVLILMWLVLFAILLHFSLHGFVLSMLTRLVEKTGRQWQQLFTAHRLFRRVALVDQGTILQIQADIFDHLFAVLPDFGLRAHESPTGHDVRALVARR